MLDILDSLKNALIILECFKLYKLACIFPIFRADKLVKKLAKSGVGIIKPSAMNDAVGNVCKLPGGHLIEIMEDGFLQNATQKLRLRYENRQRKG